MSNDSSVEDNRELHRFQLEVEGQFAVLDYERAKGSLRLLHTEVPVALRGRGLGEQLVEAALVAARTEGLQIVAVCRFVRAYMEKHPQ